MKLLPIESLDYKYVLINNYRNLKLTENELVILLLIDSLKTKGPMLITGSQLQVKMNIKEEEIDKDIVSLMNKGFLSYETIDGMLITSMKPTYDKIVEFVIKDIKEQENEADLKHKEDELTEVMKTLQDEMKRSLTPLEIDLVSNWFKDDVNINIINASINECLRKNNKLSIKAVDRMIIKKLQQEDIEEEGFSTVDEKTKIDLRKSMENAAYDWVHDDE